jgi:hypothetical protein
MNTLPVVHFGYEWFVLKVGRGTGYDIQKSNPIRGLKHILISHVLVFWLSFFYAFVYVEFKLKL